MNCPVDPDSKNLVDMLAKRKTKDSSFSLYGNTTLKRTFWTAIGFFGLLVATGVIKKLFRFDPSGWTSFLFAFAGFACSLAALAYQLLSMVPVIKDLRKISRNVDKESVADMATSFVADVALIHEIARDYTFVQIEFAGGYFKLSAAQMRERVGMIMGKIDTIGMIPTVAAAWLTWQEILIQIQNAELPHLLPAWLANSDWLFVTIAVLFATFIRLRTSAQWMEQMELLLSQAASLKRNGKAQATGSTPRLAVDGEG